MLTSSDLENGNPRCEWAASWQRAEWGQILDILLSVRLYNEIAQV